MLDPSAVNEMAKSNLPGYLGIVILEIGDVVRAEMAVRENLMAPNGFLHAGAVVTLADSCAGIGCMASLPVDAAGFTTIELKSNHLGTARDGVIECTARPLHMGRSTQVWDAEVLQRGSGKALAHFRCTQLLMYKN